MYRPVLSRFGCTVVETQALHRLGCSARPLQHVLMYAYASFSDYLSLKRVSFSSEERQTAHLHPITGTPCEVPVPKKITSIAQIPWQCKQLRQDSFEKAIKLVFIGCSYRTLEAFVTDTKDQSIPFCDHCHLINQDRLQCIPCYPLFSVNACLIVLSLPRVNKRLLFRRNESSALLLNPRQVKAPLFPVSHVCRTCAKAHFWDGR